MVQTTGHFDQYAASKQHYTESDPVVPLSSHATDVATVVCNGLCASCSTSNGTLSGFVGRFAALVGNRPDVSRLQVTMFYGSTVVTPFPSFGMLLSPALMTLRSMDDAYQLAGSYGCGAVSVVADSRRPALAQVQLSLDPTQCMLPDQAYSLVANGSWVRLSRADIGSIVPQLDCDLLVASCRPL
eukprot:3221936-Amphidinium_carterae.1